MILSNRLFLHITRISQRLYLILIIINIKLNANKLPLLLNQLISQLCHLLLGYLGLQWAAADRIDLNMESTNLSLLVFNIVLEKSYLVLVGIDILIYLNLLLVVSLSCLHLHRKYLLLRAVYL